MYNNESILCIKKKTLPKEWVLKKSIVPLNFALFVEKCSKAGFKFIDRNKAEKDPSYKQIIPYIIIQTKDKTAIYKRKGNEKRLHNLWSIGIGGHINPVDVATKDTSFKKILTAGMTRELKEELSKSNIQDNIKFKGVISEEITNVGKVHLGAVFKICTKSPGKYMPGKELLQFQWKKTKNLKLINLELWSKLALKLFDHSSNI